VSRVGIKCATNLLLTARSRAKIKMMAKKSLETGEDINDMPGSMRQYLHLQAMESGKSFGYFGGRAGLMPYGHQAALGGDQGGQGKVCKCSD